ncbi:hypothetical protein DV735_g4974, partial [Chaetothyriales sp. CBS 134920]
MEEIVGFSAAALPPLVPYRPAATNLPPQEWQACLDAWLVSIEARLRLADQQFSTLSLSDSGSGVPFLISYFRRPDSASANLLLHRCSYLLTKRLLLSIPKSNFLEQSAMLSFVLDANANFHTVSEWRQTLGQSVFVQSPLFNSSLAAWMALTGTALLSQPSSSWIEGVRKMNLQVKTLPSVGFELMKGADYLESLMHAFASSELPAAHTVVVENTYRSLLSLLSPEYTRPNSLMDQLHLLKSETGQSQNSKLHQQKKTLCSALICETSFLRHLAASTALNSTKRGRDTIDNLTEYREQTKHLHPPPARRKPKVKSKGKGKATGVGEIHIHRAASVSQVHELFPHLSAGYIVRLLDYFDDKTESVIAALLEPDSLPPHLVDGTAVADEEISATLSAPNPVPLSTPPLPAQRRRNVFDDDDFDNLQIPTSQVHRGRKAMDISQPSTAEEHNRIDTDNRNNSNSDLPEESLFRAWKATPALFARDSATRISPARQQLKRDLGGALTDEQIEGWAIMLGKDQSRQRRLEKQYSAALFGGGNQTVLAQTKWSAARAAAEDAASEENTAPSTKKSEHARQHGGFRSGRGGGRNTRREGRAKKMARGGFGGPPPDGAGS